MKFRRQLSDAHPAVIQARRRARPAFLELLLEGAGLADAFRDTDERPDLDAECREWAARADELAECAELLHSGGYTDHASPLPLRLGEQVFLVHEDAALMDRGIRVDIGTVTITNERVAFQSTTQARQFLFASLVGCQNDDSRPITYFELADDCAGVRYDAASSFRFRLRLAVALAWAYGNPRAMTPAINAELADHLAKRPGARPERTVAGLIRS